MNLLDFLYPLKPMRVLVESLGISIALSAVAENIVYAKRITKRTLVARAAILVAGLARLT